MSTLKSNGFLLRKIHYSNTSYVIDVFTQEFGRLSLIAKGARREKSSFAGRLDYCALLEFVFIDKPGGLSILTECSIEKSFRDAKQNPVKLLAGFVFLRFLREFLQERSEEKELFNTTDVFFRGLAVEQKLSTLNWYLHALLKVLEHAGYKPNMDHCGKCGNRLEGDVLFDAGGDVLICSECMEYKKEKKCFEISDKCVTIIKRLQGAGRGPEDFNFMISENNGREIERFIVTFASAVLQKDITFISTGYYNEDS